MNKKRAALSLCAVALVAAGTLRLKTTPPDAAAQAGAPPAAAHKEMPEHKAYEFLFRRIARFRKRVNEAGKPSAKDTGLQREAGLSDQQFRALEAISESCLREAEALDAEAAAVVREFRERHFPGGKLPAGRKVPPPPPELEAMQRRRDAIMTRGRGRALAALGDGSFGRLDKFVKERFAGKLPDAYADRVVPTTRNGN